MQQTATIGIRSAISTSPVSTDFDTVVAIFTREWMESVVTAIEYAFTFHLTENNELFWDSKFDPHKTITIMWNVNTTKVKLLKTG